MVYIVPALLAIVLVEAILSGRWYEPYFRAGFVIYRNSMQLADSLNEPLSAERLTDHFRGGFGPSLQFHELAHDEIAFREALFELKLFSYSPVMHGLIRHRPESHLLVVEGRANWFTVAFTVTVLCFVAQRLDAWPAVPFLAAILGAIYAIQVKRYGSVARCAAERNPPVVEPGSELGRARVGHGGGCPPGGRSRVLVLRRMTGALLERHNNALNLTSGAWQAGAPLAG